MTTLQIPTSSNIEDKSMSSQEDSPASLFPMPVNGGGQSDDRYLWPEMLRVIDEIRPTWVVGENVAGISTMVESCEITHLGGEASLFEEDNGVHRFRAEHTFTIERICRDLESKGYSVQPVLIPACAVGAPHRRDRVFIVAHTIGERLERQDESRSREGGKRMHIWRDFTGCCGAYGEGLRPEERWSDFPSVSPVHRGNDGLPFDVDNLTIPFSKWRNESLKAYGNAIVPQVMYRIFQCVEKLSAL